MKKCIQCKKAKKLSEYYAHPKTKDGHLGKCKECVKSCSKENGERKSKNPAWVEQEKIRAREKYHRLGYKDIHKATPEDKKAIMARYKNKYPEKIRAQISSSRIGVEDGYERHHWSYNEAHHKDVIVLSVENHAALHRYMIYDQERMMYRRTDTNELLDTRELHESYMKQVLAGRA